jgi:hypothetical protein
VSTCPPRARLRAQELPAVGPAAAQPQGQRPRAHRGRAQRVGGDGVVVGHSAEAEVELHLEFDLPAARVRRDSRVRDEGAELSHREPRRVIAGKVRRTNKLIKVLLQECGFFKFSFFMLGALAFSPLLDEWWIDGLIDRQIYERQRKKES